MYHARLKNRVVAINEDKAKEYAKMGYLVTDTTGEVIYHPEATTLEGAKNQIKQLKEQIDDKDEAIKTLKKENAQLKKKLAEYKKTEKAE